MTILKKDSHHVYSAKCNMPAGTKFQKKKFPAVTSLLANEARSLNKVVITLQDYALLLYLMFGLPSEQTIILL